MGPHPDLAGIAVPRAAVVGDFLLTPLDTSVVDEDFAVVRASSDVLCGLFEDLTHACWPDGLTLDDNALDLAWHDRDFTLMRSLSWVVRDAGGDYLGCAYVFPDPGARGTGRVFTWIRDRPDRLALLAGFNAAFARWLARTVPAAGAYPWTSNDAG